MIFPEDDWQVVRPEETSQAPLSGHRDISPTHQRKQAPLIYPGIPKEKGPPFRVALV